MLIAKSLLVVAAAAVAFASSNVAHAGIGPVSFRVEQPSNTTNEKDKKTVKKSLKIILSNGAAEDADVKIKYSIFGRDVDGKDVKALDSGERGATVKGRSTEIVETSKATAVIIDAKVDPKTRKRTPASGTKFLGYGVQVFDNKDGKLLGESYDPTSMKDSMAKPPAAAPGAVVPAPAPAPAPAAPVK